MAGTIVIVDDVGADTGGIEEAIREVLSDTGVFSISSESAEPTFVAERNPDLVLIDVQSGGGLGAFDLASRLRRAEATRMIPVLMVSADGRPERPDSRV